MPPTASGTFGQRLLHQLQKGDWQRCLESLQSCAAAGGELRTLPHLSAVLSQLLRKGRWREVLQLEPQLLSSREATATPAPLSGNAHRHMPARDQPRTLHAPDTTSTSTSPTAGTAPADILRVLLAAATCPAAVASAEPPTLEAVTRLCRRLFSAGEADVPEVCRAQAEHALRAWQQRAAAGELSVSLTLRRDMEECLTSLERQGSRSAPAQDTTVASSTALARAHSLATVLRELSRRVGDAAQSAAVTDADGDERNADSNELRKHVTAVEARLRSLKGAPTDEVLGTALILYAHVHSPVDVSDGGVHPEIASWAAHTILQSSFPLTGARSAAQHVAALLLAGAALTAQSQRQPAVLFLRVPSIRSSATVHAELALTVCQSVNALSDTASRVVADKGSEDGSDGASLFRALSACVHGICGSLCSSPGEDGAHFASPTALTLRLLTDSTRVASQYAGVALVSGGACAESAALALAQLLDAATNLLSDEVSLRQLATEGTGHSVAESLARLWAVVVGDAAVAELCGRRMPLAVVRATEPHRPHGHRDAVRCARVLARMRALDMWMRVSATYLGGGGTSPDPPRFSIDLPSTDAVNVDDAQCQVAYVPAEPFSTAMDNRHSALDAGDEPPLLSDGSRDSLTSNTTADAWSEAAAARHEAMARAEMDDVVASWYARVVLVMAGLPTAVGEDTPSPVTALVRSLPSALTNKPDNSLRVAVHLAVLCAQLTPQQGLTYTAASVRCVHSFLVALPPVSLTRVSSQLLRLAPPSASGLVREAAAVWRLAATAALQRRKSSLTLEQKAEAVRTCLAAFTDVDEASSLSAADAARLLVSCDAASIRRQGEAVKALAAVLSAPATLEPRDTGEHAAATHTLGTSASSLDQVLHILVERTQPARWADALATLAEASAASAELPRAVPPASTPPTASAVSQQLRREIVASLLAAERGATPFPLAQSQSTVSAARRTATDNAAVLPSLTNTTGRALSASEHDALRESLKPLRAASNVRAAIQVFYGLERDGLRLSLLELEWFAFAVKRGPLAFATRVLTYLGEETHSCSRSLGMAVVQCAVNTYMRARVAVRDKGTQAKNKPRAGSRHAGRHKPPTSSPSTLRPQRLIAYECRVLAARGIGLLPRRRAQAQHEAQQHRHESSHSLPTRQLTDHGAPDTESAQNRSVRISERDGLNDAATARRLTGVRDFQKLVKSARQLCHGDASAARLFLSGAGAFTLASVIEASEVLEHTVHLCLEVGDRDTAVKAYLAFQETWAHAPVPSAVLLALLRLEYDWLRDTASTIAPREPRLLMVGTSEPSSEASVTTQWAPRTRRLVKQLHHQPPSRVTTPTSPPQQLLTFVRDGLRLALENTGSEPASSSLWSSPVATFMTAMFETLFDLRLVPDLVVQGSTIVHARGKAVLFAECGGVVPTVLFAPSSERAGTTLDATTAREVVCLCARALTCTTDAVAVVEGSSVLFGGLQQVAPVLRGRSDVAVRESCAKVLIHLAKVLQCSSVPTLSQTMELLPPMTTTTTPLGPSPLLSLPSIAFTDVDTALPGCTLAEVYESVYDTIAGPLGFRTFAERDVRGGSGSPRTAETPLGAALAVCEQLRQLDNVVQRQQQQPLVAPEEEGSARGEEVVSQEPFLLLFASANIAVDGLHTQLAGYFHVKQAEAEAEVEGASQGSSSRHPNDAAAMWFDACLSSFTTCVALLDRAETMLNDEGLLHAALSHLSGADTKGTLAFAHHAAATHVRQHLSSTAVTLLADLAAWWRSVDTAVADRHSPDGGGGRLLQLSHARRQRLLWVLTVLCRRELRHAACADGSVRPFSADLAVVVAAVQRAVHRAASLTTSERRDPGDLDGPADVAPDERLVADSLAVFCDRLTTPTRDGAHGATAVRRRLPSSLHTVAHTLTTFDAEVQPLAEGTPVSLLLWTALPIVLHVALDGTQRYDWQPHARAVQHILRSHPPCGGSPTLTLPADLQVLGGALAAVALSDRGINHLGEPHVGAILDAVLHPTLFDGAEVRFARTWLSGTLTAAPSSLSDTFLHAVACLVAHQAARDETVPARAWGDVVGRIGEHRPHMWRLAKSLLLYTPFALGTETCAADEDDRAEGSLASDFAERVCTALTYFGPWPPHELLELQYRLAAFLPLTGVTAPSLASARKLLCSLLPAGAPSAFLCPVRDATDEGSSCLSSPWCPASPELIAGVEMAQNGSETHSPVGRSVPSAAAALLPQRALLDGLPFTGHRPVTVLTALTEPMAVSAAPRRRRFTHAVPPLPRAEPVASMPHALPTLSWPLSQFTTAAALREMQRAAHAGGAAGGARVSSQLSNWRAQLRLPATTDACTRPASVASSSLSQVTRTALRFTSASLALGAGVSADGAQAEVSSLQSCLVRVACACDAEALTQAVSEAGAHAVGRGDAILIAESLTRLWHIVVARLTELTVYHQHVHKRGLKDLHTTLARPVYRAFYERCEAQRCAAPAAFSALVEDVLGHVVATSLEARVSQATTASTTRQPFEAPTRARLDAIVADTSFAKQIAAELSTDGATGVSRLDALTESVRHAARRLLAIETCTEAQDGQSALWSCSVWAPALWERLQLQHLLRAAGEVDTPSHLVVRHPVVVSEIMRDIASPSSNSRLHLARRRLPQDVETPRRGLGEAVDLMREYCDTGACVVTAATTPLFAATPFTGVVRAPVGAALVLDELVAVLSAWGRRGELSKARRDGEWLSVVRFVVDETFPSARARPSVRSSMLHPAHPHDGVFEGYLPSSWHNMLGLIVDRIGFDQRRAPTVDYAEAVYARLSHYAAAVSEMVDRTSHGNNEAKSQPVLKAVGAIQPLAWSGQNWQVLLHFFLQTHALAVTFVSPAGWHAERQAVVNAAWTLLLSFLSLAVTTGHGSLNLWSPHTMNAVLAVSTVAHEDDGMNGGDATRVVSIVLRRCQGAPEDTAAAAPPRRLLTTRGLQRFFSGAWRRCSQRLDAQLWEWLVECDAAPEKPAVSRDRPLTALKEATTRRGQLPSHGVFMALLDLALREASSPETQGTTARVSEKAAHRVTWSTWGLALCDLICPFMAMTPLLFERVLRLFAHQPLQETRIAHHLAHYLARYQDPTLLTATGVATLVHMTHRLYRVRDANADNTALGVVSPVFIVLCRAVQGLSTLTECDAARLLRPPPPPDTTTCVTAASLQSIREGCLDFLADAAHHSTAHDEVFLRVGRRTDDWLSHLASTPTAQDTTNAQPWFTRALCERLSACLEAHVPLSTREAVQSGDCAMLALPPVARILRSYEAFQRDADARSPMNPFERTEADAVRRRVVSVLLKLSVAPTSASSASQSAGASRAGTGTMPSVSWAQALALLFPTNVHAHAPRAPVVHDAGVARSGAKAPDDASLAADALRLVVRAKPEQQWGAAVRLYETALLASPSACTGRPATVLTYQLLNYITQDGAAARMPLTVLDSLGQHLLRLEEEEDAQTPAHSGGDSHSQTLATQQIHNRAAVLDALARELAAHPNMTLLAARRWSDRFERLMTAWQRAALPAPATTSAGPSSALPPLPYPWRTFTSSFVRRLMEPGAFAASPQDLLEFALACGLTQNRDTQRWLVHTASLAAPTRVPALLQLFTAEPTSEEASPAMALRAQAALRAQKQVTLRALMAEDAAEITAAHTALLSDLLRRRPTDRQSAREAAHMCQMHPRLLSTPTFCEVCAALAQGGHAAQLVSFFTSLLSTEVPRSPRTFTQEGDKLLSAMSTACVRQAVHAYTLVWSRGPERVTLEASLESALLLVAELVARGPWAVASDRLADNEVSAALFTTLSDALRALARPLFGVHAALSVAPLVFFSQPVSALASAALQPLYTAIESHVLAGVAAPQWLSHGGAADVLQWLAAVCVCERPDLSTRLFSMLLASPTHTDGQLDTPAAVTLYHHYAEQWRLRQTALQACTSSNARERLALQWRAGKFLDAPAAPLETTTTPVTWCTHISFVAAATRALGHLEGVSLAHIQSLVAAVTGVASAMVPDAAVPCLSLHLALLQWWWTLVGRTRQRNPSFDIPTDHLQTLLRTIQEQQRTLSQSLPDSPGSLAIVADHWRVSASLTRLALGMAYTLGSVREGTRAAGRQLVALLSVTEPFVLNTGEAGVDGESNGVATGAANRPSFDSFSPQSHPISSLHEAVRCVRRWTCQDLAQGALGATAHAELEHGVTTALVHSHRLLEYLSHAHAAGREPSSIVTRWCPSANVLARRLVPQLCRDALSLTMDTVAETDRRVTDSDLPLDASRLQLLVSCATLIDEVTLQRTYAHRSDDPFSSTLTAVQHIFSTLRPHVLLRPSESTLTLLRLVCVRARGQEWRSLLHELTESYSAVAVRVPLYSPMDERARQERLRQALGKLDSYEAAWALCSEQRQRGLRLHWPCYAALLELCTNDAAHTRPGTLLSLDERWARVEGWLYALLRDGVSVPVAAAYETLLGNIIGDDAEDGTAPYVRQFAELVSVMPLRDLSGKGEGRLTCAAPPLSVVSAVTTACAGTPTDCDIATVDSPTPDILSRFLARCLESTSFSVVLDAASVEKAVMVLCACRQTPHLGGSVGGLLKRALWRDDAGAVTASHSRWRDERGECLKRLPDRAHVLVALRLLAQQSSHGVRVAWSVWVWCFDAVAAVLLPDTAHSEETDGLVRRCFQESLASSAEDVAALVAWRSRLALALSEQSLWWADRRALRREAACLAPWRARRRLTDTVGTSFTAAVMGHVWSSYVTTLQRYASPTDALLHQVILQGYPRARRGQPPGAHDDRMPSPTHHTATDAEDDDDAALDELVNGVSAPDTAPVASAHLQQLASDLQALRNMFLHAQPGADLQYPFAVIMERLMGAGRWMEAFAWLEAASLRFDRVLHSEQEVDGTGEDEDALLDYAKLSASNADRLADGDGDRAVLVFPPSAVRLPTAPVRAVAAHATLSPLLLWMLVERSQVLPALDASVREAGIGQRAAGAVGTRAARLTNLRRRAVLDFATSWVASQQDDQSQAGEFGLTWAVLKTSLSATGDDEHQNGEKEP